MQAAVAAASCCRLWLPFLNVSSIAVQAETIQPAAQGLPVEVETAATQGGSFLGRNLLAQLAELGMDAARLEREHPAAVDQVH